MQVDLYFSFRSPYSYLILPRMVNLRDKHNVNVNFKLVYPLAIREPEFFKGKNLLTYFYIRSIDYKKHAKLNGMKFVAPKPDPINQNMLTGKISKHQPYIFKLCHFCQAIEKSKQLDFALEVSNLIFGGFQDWHMDESISAVTAKLGLNFNDIEQSRQQNDDKLKDEILLNQKQQLEAGHHGVPLTVYKDKFFFGQDRFHHLISALEQDGLIYK
ncbi:MAG: DsbA family protein [Candidatus Pelagibacterales bacterium]